MVCSSEIRRVGEYIDSLGEEWERFYLEGEVPEKFLRDLERVGAVVESIHVERVVSAVFGSLIAVMVAEYLGGNREEAKRLRDEVLCYADALKGAVEFYKERAERILEELGGV